MTLWRRVNSQTDRGQLRDLLQEVRRIADLDDAKAFGGSRSTGFHSGRGGARGRHGNGGMLGRGLEAGKECLRQELAAARFTLQHPSRIGAFEPIRLRQAIKEPGRRR